MKRSQLIFTQTWQWALAIVLSALLVAGIMMLYQSWQRRKRQQAFLNIYEAKMRRAIQEAIDSRAQVRKEIFQNEDLRALERETYLTLGKAAGDLLNQLFKDFDVANDAIKKVAKQKKLSGVKLQSVMWKEDLRTQIELYSEALAPFVAHEKSLDAIVEGMRSQYFSA